MHQEQAIMQGHAPQPLILGKSPQIAALAEHIERVAATTARVLIVGESGSGKELVARSIHARSARAAEQFVAINCGAIAASLIEDEIFGHERGSFTGALRTHAGVFERAHGGTLFLDEITEMPTELQVRLLRVLESGRFFRVGGHSEIEVDVRVIAATNRCPWAAARAGRLREDLLYRLAVFPIDVPPLRERGDDVLLLAEHFLATLNQQAGTTRQFTPASLSVLREHGWPGNVRELRNAIERAFILADTAVALTPLTSPRLSQEGLGIAVGSSLADAERSLIEATLRHFDDNKPHAAAVLGCSLKTLYNKLNGYLTAGAVA